MSYVTIVYRKHGDHASGFVVSASGENEGEIIRILDKFLLCWCGKRCYAEHGIPVFFVVPLFVKGRHLTCRLPAAFRRSGFVVSSRHAH